MGSLHAWFKLAELERGLSNNSVDLFARRATPVLLRPNLANLFTPSEFAPQHIDGFGPIV